MNPEKLTEKWTSKIVPWGLSIYVLFLSVTSSYINHRNIIQEKHIYLLTAIFLALFPFISEIRIAGILELKKTLKETKEEVREHKREVRDMLSVMTTNINSVSTNNQKTSINFQLPINSAQDLEDRSSQEIQRKAEEIKEEILTVENEDTIMALVKIRMTLERSLREILDKRLRIKDSNKDIKYASIGKLISIFLEEYKHVEFLRESFDYTRRISNSAVHGQNISQKQGEEAIELGVNLIAYLKDFQLTNGN